jgi:oligoendopeptidase F
MANTETTTDLPTWDLGDLYAGPDAPAITRDLDDAQAATTTFGQQFQGKISSLSPSDFAAAITRYEEIQEALGRVGSYAQLLHAGDLTDPAIAKFAQDIRERLNAISMDLIFFTLEINRLDDGLLKDLLTGAADKYRPWIDNVRAHREHELADDVEKLFHEKAVTSSGGWSRLFDETLAASRYDVGAEQLTLEETLNRLSSPDRERRRLAAGALAATFEKNATLFALITNILAKDKEIEDRWRHFSEPAASRHLANLVEPEVVNALEAAVVDSYERTAHRYYALKSRWLGVDQLEHYDRNAPLPEAEERLIPWDDARNTVLDAYGRFSDDLRQVGTKFFDNAWIDAQPRAGKAPGAFAHPTVTSAHPYLLLNYQGKVRDVMTLAHELGHGVHQILAGPNGALMADTPLTLAETASVFGEQLVFRALLDAEDDPARRRHMLASKVEDMINTVVRQIAFYRFEKVVHNARADGELTLSRLGDIWLETQTESLGPAIHLGSDYRNYWSYIPHFIHSPFYVYAYAFGDCLVNALYAVFQESESGFQDRYLDMLRAGGTKRHDDLLAPFGLDASDPAFWQRGLDLISGFIDDLEKMDAR